MTRILALVALSLSLAATGCGSKLKLEETFALLPDGKVYEIDPIKKEQKVNIALTSPGAPVDLYVYTSQYRNEIERNLFSAKGDKFLAREQKSEKIDLTVTVPANVMLVVNIQQGSAKEAKAVSIKITN